MRRRNNHTLLNLSYMEKKKTATCIRISEPGSWKGAPSIHAEESVMRSIQYDAKRKWTLASICIKIDMRSGTWKLHNGHPCSSCARSIQRKGIRHVVYSTEDGMVRETIRNILLHSKPSSGYRRCGRRCHEA